VRGRPTAETGPAVNPAGTVAEKYAEPARASAREFGVPSEAGLGKGFEEWAGEPSVFGFSISARPPEWL